MRNLNSDLEGLKAYSVKFFLSAIWWLDDLKRIEKIIQETAFKWKKETGIKIQLQVSANRPSNNWALVKSVSWAFWYFIGRWICCWRFFFRVWSPASVLLITGLHQDWFVTHTVNSSLKGKLKYAHLYSLVQSCQQTVIGWWLTLNMPMFDEILPAVKHDDQTSQMPLKNVILYLNICLIIWRYKERNWIVWLKRWLDWTRPH